MKRHWPILILIALAIVLAKQGMARRSANADLHSLETTITTLDNSLASMSEQSNVEVSPEEIDLAALKTRASRVHELRGDATMARQDLERTKATHRQTQARQQERSNALAFAARPVFPEGYISNTTLQNVGQATPEATVESFFYGNIHGDIDLAASCYDRFEVPDGADAETRSSLARETGELFGEFPGYQTVSREQLAPDKARIGIRTAPETETIYIVLYLTDRNWVINADESDLFK